MIFAKGPVDKIVNSKAAFDIKFVIPPGATNHEIKAVYEFEQDSHIVSLMPHMHVRGKDIVYRAIYPDGRSEILLAVPRYNFDWQVYYYPAKPLAAPKGTRLEAVAHSLPHRGRHLLGEPVGVNPLQGLGENRQG